MEPRKGFNGKECWVMGGCGRLFDRYGFGPCVFAGALGRILRMDPYSPKPIMFGMHDMCRHCICSLTRKDQWRLWEEARKGLLGFPTKTYAEGLKRLREEPFEFKRFGERVC
jgi:hypothetical protein